MPHNSGGGSRVLTHGCAMILKCTLLRQVCNAATLHTVPDNVQ